MFNFENIHKVFKPGETKAPLHQENSAMEKAKINLDHPIENNYAVNNENVCSANGNNGSVSNENGSSEPVSNEEVRSETGNDHTSVRNMDQTSDPKQHEQLEETGKKVKYLTGRASGILCAISSLPSKYGIGCLSKEAYDFVDFLKNAGQSYWQILPVGPTSFGDSPYQSFSTFAGNPYFIDLDQLVKDELLTEEECQSPETEEDPYHIDYGALYRNRFPVLRLAFNRFKKAPAGDYPVFKEKNAYWLDDYALFMTLKMANKGRSWDEWDEDLAVRKPSAVEEAKNIYRDEIEFYKFQQYEFDFQWKKLRSYAHQNNIHLIGDIPIYVAYDSSDTWAHKEMFQFDENHKLAAVAGCPPDGFSAAGQIWGNPLYNWKYHMDTDYAWWISRIRASFDRVDVVRIDHFRGFDEYFSIPYGAETAVNGHWEKGPGMALFDAIRKSLGDVSIIAEDLGYLTDSVLKLVEDTGFPGMKVLQFAFDWSENSYYLPYKYNRNSVVYTGTHDNETTLGWIGGISDHDRDFARRYANSMNTSYEAFVWDFIRVAAASVSDTCIIPLQDYLVLGNEARMNFPSSVGGINWQWRMKKDALSKELCDSIRKMTQTYGRLRTDPS